MLVVLDSSPENMTSELALEADSVLPDTWNGWVRPIASADAFARFLDICRTNDPNGLWDYAIEADGQVRLQYEDEEFSLYGVRDDGVALYDLTGWTWVALDVGTTSEI